jgi:hypothetical protein
MRAATGSEMRKTVRPREGSRRGVRTPAGVRCTCRPLKLLRAIAEFGARGMEGEKVRTRWIVGQMLVLRGDSAHGLPVLRKAKRS